MGWQMLTRDGFPAAKEFYLLRGHGVSDILNASGASLRSAGRRKPVLGEMYARIQI